MPCGIVRALSQGSLMKKLLGKVVQAMIISTIAVVAILNSSVQNAREAKIETNQTVTVVTSE